MEKMPHRSDCQIWRRTAERPVGSCLPAPDDSFVQEMDLPKDADGHKILIAR
jgi:hypothetical protein